MFKIKSYSKAELAMLYLAIFYLFRRSFQSKKIRVIRDIRVQ